MAGGKVPLTFKLYKGDELIREEKLTLPVIKVGKLSSSHLRLDDKNVSRMHALIEVTGPGVAPRLDAQWQQDWETRGAPVTKPTFFEKCVIAAVTAMDKLNLSWW